MKDNILNRFGRGAVVFTMALLAFPLVNHIFSGSQLSTVQTVFYPLVCGISFMAIEFFRDLYILHHSRHYFRTIAMLSEVPAGVRLCRGVITGLVVLLALIVAQVGGYFPRAGGSFYLGTLLTCTAISFVIERYRDRFDLSELRQQRK